MTLNSFTWSINNNVKDDARATVHTAISVCPTLKTQEWKDNILYEKAHLKYASFPTKDDIYDVPNPPPACCAEKVDDCLSEEEVHPQPQCKLATAQSDLWSHRVPNISTDDAAVLLSLHSQRIKLDCRSSISWQKCHSFVYSMSGEWTSIFCIDTSARLSV